MKFKKFWAVVLSVAMLLGVMPVFSFAASVSSMNSAGGITVYNKTDYSIVDGVTETTVYMRNGSNENVIGHLATIDSKDVTFKASYGGYYTAGSTVASRKTAADNWNKWQFAKTTDQAAAYETANDTEGAGSVIMAINADYFDMTNGRPLGNMIMEGNKNMGSNVEPYFAVLKDGSYAFRDAGADTSDVLEAISGPFFLIRNGANVMDPNNMDLMPRQSIGVTADGKIVLFEIDGRQEKSVGTTLYEQAELLKSAGCVDAIYLDGGGSATFCSKREGTDKLEVQNSPSDGVERQVSSALLLVRTAKTDGVFDHASLSPNGEAYTPGSSINFAAIGVDKYGGSAELPEGLKWQLAADSAEYGSIDENTGVFTANEIAEAHEVTVQLSDGENVVGSTSITIATPDEIKFTNDSLNLDYEARSNLGLSVYYNGKAINIKPGDLIWTIDDERAGAMDGDTFVAAANNAQGDLSVKSLVSVQSKWNEEVNGAVTVGIGTKPVVVMDGGDADGLNYDNIAYVHADANGGGLAFETHADDHGDVIVVHYINSDGTSRGGVASAEVVGLDNGQVRFGEKALKLNYDFTNIIGIEGACVGFDHDILVEGSPTAVGIWVYAPEGTPNLWVRLRLRDGNGTIQTKDFTERGDLATDGTHGGINWEGWKYITCDLTGVQGPITLIGGETFRLMDTRGGQGDMGTWVCTKDASGNVSEARYVGHQKGYLYLDNMQFVYGNDPADTDNPEITSIQGGADLTNLAEISGDGSTEYTSNQLNFYATFGDVQNKRTTGIDFAYVYVDNVNMTDSDECYVSTNDGKLYLNNLKLPNGTHSLKILTRDKAGNESVISRTFNVNGSNEGLTSVYLSKGAESAVLGSSYSFDINSNKLDDIAGVNTKLLISAATPVKDVKFAEGFEGKYSYNQETGELGVTINRAEGSEATGEGALATVEISVPGNLANNSYLEYRVTDGKIDCVEEKADDIITTFASQKTSIPVVEAYSVVADIMLVGAENGKITVKDATGKAAEGVEVYAVEAEDVLLGTTDENGELILDKYNGEVQAFTLYAKGDKGYSFRIKGQSVAPIGNEDGSPYNILSLATVDPSTEKNISWLANPMKTEAKAIIKYATKADYEENGESALITVEGKNTLMDYTGSGNINNNYSNYVNSAVIKGLTPDTEYVFCVGDGEIWSAPATFKTGAAVTDTSVDTTKFFVIGDTQADGESLDNLSTITEKLKSGYDFGIQIGDALEEPSLYKGWSDILTAFEKFGSTDMIHVIGNHETFGDDAAVHANAIFNTPDHDFYSVTYGNVYVATIAYTVDNDVLRQSAQKLIDDAKKSDADWKILTLHQPPYYTNPEGGSEIINEVVAPAAEAAGIDLVFSGHDHSYARTAPLTNGEVAENLAKNENEYAGTGTTYFICGSTGEKSYAVYDNPDFHFVKADQNFSHGIYLSVEATNDKIEVTVYDGDEVYDTFTKVTDCAVNGHNYTSYSDGKFYCDKCGKGFDVPEYNGEIKDKATGKNMFFINGEYQTGFTRNGEDMMLFDENGLGMTASFTLYDTEYNFENGAYAGSSDSEAGEVEFGFCGAAEDGKNLMYAYHKGDGIMNIDYNPLQKGTPAEDGTMKDWRESVRDLPWYNYRYDIKTINVAEGITNLGDRFMETALNPATVGLQGKEPVLTTVNLPSTLEKIGYRAFYHATNVEIIIPESVKEIGDQAFTYDSHMKLTFVSENPPSVGVGLFANTGEGATITCPANQAWNDLFKVKAYDGTINFVPPVAIGTQFVSGPYRYQKTHEGTVAIIGAVDKKIASVTVPATVKYCGVEYQVTAVGNRAFMNYANLEKFTSGVNVKTIGVQAFEGAKALKTVAGTSAVLTVGNRAFRNCTSLVSISTLMNAKTIGEYAFANDAKLYQIGGTEGVIGLYGVTTLYKQAFVYCTNIRKVVASPKLKVIGVSAFEGDTKLASVSGTSGVTHVGHRAFRKCASLATISTLANARIIGDYAFHYCSKLYQIGGTKAVIGLYKVQSIGKQAFAFCSNIRQVYIKAPLKTIGSAAFYGTKNCSKVTVNSAVLKSVGENAFKGIKAKAQILVPSSKLGAYRNLLKGKSGGATIAVIK